MQKVIKIGPIIDRWIKDILNVKVISWFFNRFGHTTFNLFLAGRTRLPDNFLMYSDSDLFFGGGGIVRIVKVNEERHFLNLHWNYMLYTTICWYVIKNHISKFATFCHLSFSARNSYFLVKFCISKYGFWQRSASEP